MPPEGRNAAVVMQLWDGGLLCLTRFRPSRLWVTAVLPWFTHRGCACVFMNTQHFHTHTHTHTQHLLFWACLPVTVCLRCHCLAPGGFIKAQCPEVKSHSSPLLWSGSSSTSPPTTLPVFSPPICVCSPPFIFLLSVLTLPPFLSFKGPPSLKKKRRKKIKNKGGMKTGCRKESVSCLSEEPACLMTPSPVGYESSSSSPNFLFCLHIN